MLLHNLKKNYPEVLFILKFLLLFLFLYQFVEFWIGISSKGGLYVPFIDEYFNGVKWYRVFILKSAAAVHYLFSYPTHLLSSITLEGYNGYRVNMVYSCIGYGIICFWAAFVFSFPITLKHKLQWLALGFILLFMLNVLRISILLFVINKTKNVESFSMHHTYYNVCSYALIFMMIYFFVKKSSLVTEV
jgi:exosortase/archaeosortase family protein